jgi:hypothetical protein
MSICKYCGNPIEGETVMNPDEYGNGYHHFCLVDKEFREERKRIYNKGKADAFRWIPVSERLPEVNQKVLVTSYGRTCYAMMISIDGNNGYPVFRLQDSLKERVVCETTEHGEFTKGRITAWMPLPEPYKEGVSE